MQLAFVYMVYLSSQKCRYQNVVKMEVCSCPAAVDVTIVRPDVKFQLGFTVQDGVVSSHISSTVA